MNYPTITNGKMNKSAFEAYLTEHVKAAGVIPVLKLKCKQLILPPWESLGLFAMMHAFMPMTPEHPDGTDVYDPDKWRSLVRFFAIEDGAPEGEKKYRVLFDHTKKAKKQIKEGKTPDNFCWKNDKVQKLIDGGKTTIINHTPAGRREAQALLDSLGISYERNLVAAMLQGFTYDFHLAVTDEEDRCGFFITQEMFDAGWTHCVDEYAKVDENDDAEVTELCVGDFIVVNTKEDGSFSGYCVERQMFDISYYVY